MQGTECRKGDQGRDGRFGQSRQAAGQHVDGDLRTVGDARMAQGMQKGEIGQQVQPDDDAHAAEHGAQDVALRIAHFGCHVGHFVPATVTEQNQDECDPDRQAVRRQRQLTGCVRRAVPAVRRR